MNYLYYGDNLDVMRRHLKDESVDLVYLDPPFNSNANYNVLFQEHDNTKSSSQVMAFEDTWHWDQTAAFAYEEAVEHGERVADVMRAFRTFLGTNDMLAYLSMMAPRLVEIRRIMKPTASIYLHCDPTSSHYLKLLMDAVFGPERYHNEIIWRRYGAHNDVAQGSRHFGRVHDSILVYCRSELNTWNQPFVPLSASYIDSTYRYIEPETGRRFRSKPLTAPGGAEKGNPTYEWNGHTRFWRYSQTTMQKLHDEGKLYYSKTGYVSQKHYLDESKGVPVQDVWEDIPALAGSNIERLGYPTQKPVSLLERIISTSSNPGNTVFDPFCGCGTAIDAAQKLGRQWIGIDITHLAIGLIRHRLRGAGVQMSDYKVIGEPTDLSGAIELAETDPYQFQWWALGLLGARPTEQKKGADRGIDGRLYFHDDSGGDTKQVIFSVKAGKVQSSYVRDLVGVINRENAQIGVLISLNHSTQEMRTEAAAAGFYESGWSTRHPRIQLVTIEEILAGKTLDLPLHRNRTLKKSDRAPSANSAKRAKRAAGVPPESLFDDGDGEEG